jgi:phosphate transport system substrate-binding protein
MARCGTSPARVGALAALFLMGLTLARAAEVSGAGATFPYPIYAKWADTYKKETGDGLNYQSIGSGGGIKQIQAKTVTFGATDMPLSGKQLDKDGLIQFPMVIGGVVLVVNLEGVIPGQLTLNGETLAKIFLGEVKTWDDTAIKKLNPGFKLPSQAIIVIRRSDGSGTTFVFTDYLAKVSPDWKAKVGVNTALEWPVGIGAKGNEGVANNVMQMKGSIGYVEYAYARPNKLAHTKLENHDGKVVEPNLCSFQAGQSTPSGDSVPGFGVILTDQLGAESWPITSATFILMHKKPTDVNSAAIALKFFAWAYQKGGQMASELDYVPMPKNVVNMVMKEWSLITGPEGKPLM